MQWEVNNLGPTDLALIKSRAECEVRARPFSKGHISKKIPPTIAVSQYLGFLPAIASMSSLRRGGRVRL